MSAVKRVDKLVSELTLEEKVSLCHGIDFMSTTPVERLGIPRMWMSDGPAGARGRGWGGPTSTWFPCGTALGATWDTELVREVGAAIGDNLIAKGAIVLLGPTMNIHRSPLAGRNFECYSEDPFLTSRMAVAYIEGLQSRGVGACAKHFVCNDSEFERMTISSEVGDRALREIYLPPFEASVREAGSWWVMGAYNALNGVMCCENAELLQTILRDEWGFDGVVVSDWWALKSTVGAANGGCDLEMPGPGRFFRDALLDAVRSGDVDEATIDAKVRRLLTTMERADILDRSEEPIEQALDRPEDRELVRRAGAESIVLLRNEDNVLPLDGVETLAVIGPLADVAAPGGGGSATMTPHYEVTPLDAIREVVPGAVFARGCTAYRQTPELPARLVRDATIEFFDDLDLQGDVMHSAALERFDVRWVNDAPVEGRFSARVTGTFTPDTDGAWTLSLLAAGRARLFLDDELVVDNWTSPEPGEGMFGLASAEQRAIVDLASGRDYALRLEYRSRAPMAAGFHVGALPPGADDLARAVDLARQADAAVVVCGTGPDWETEGRDRESMDLPGPQDDLIRAIAAANPRTVVVLVTGAPVTMPWADDVPAILSAFFGGQEAGHAIADVLFGRTNPCGKLPTTYPVRYEDNPAFVNYPGEGGRVHYGEGIFVGYRYYDAKDVAPRFPFGHGLSYTTFEYGDLTVDRDAIQAGDDVVASIDVTNSGGLAGKEVVQLYVRNEHSSFARPRKELKAFRKVALEPGETTTVGFTLDERALSFWNPATHEWTAEPGDFELLCGSSSRDIRATARFTLLSS